MQVYSGSIIQNIFSPDVGVNLLRSKAAPVIIPFLFENFKLQIRQQIYSFELEEKLTEYIQNHINAETELEEELDKRENELLKNLDNKKRAKKYDLSLLMRLRSFSANLNLSFY